MGQGKDYCRHGLEISWQGPFCEQCRHEGYADVQPPPLKDDALGEALLRRDVGAEMAALGAQVYNEGARAFADKAQRPPVTEALYGDCLKKVYGPEGLPEAQRLADEALARNEAVWQAAERRIVQPPPPKGDALGEALLSRQPECGWSAAPGSWEEHALRKVVIKANRIPYPAGRSNTLPLGSAERKRVPLYSTVLRFFPAALCKLAEICRLGSEKHNPGQTPIHNRDVSKDHADCIVRHLIDLSEDYGHGVGRDENGVPQVGYILWRAAALAQEWLEENEGAPRAPAAMGGKASAE